MQINEEVVGQKSVKKGSWGECKSKVLCEERSGEWD